MSLVTWHRCVELCACSGHVVCYTELAVCCGVALYKTFCFCSTADRTENSLLSVATK